MNRKTAGYAACAAVAGWMALSGCASAPGSAREKGAAAPAMTDISQVPGLESTLYVTESASVTRPPRMRSQESLADAAMRRQTEGMTPGAAGGPRDQVVIRIPEAAPEAAKPPVAIPALQPGAESRPPMKEASWKKPLPPLQSLEGR